MLATRHADIIYADIAAADYASAAGIAADGHRRITMLQDANSTRYYGH